MELRLPEGKLEKMRVLLADIKDKSYIDRKSLERITGYLAHCATIIRGGRLFCRRLYDLYKVVLTKNIRHIRIPASAREDILWWCEFAERFNGKAATYNPECQFAMFSDSSFHGYGVYIAGDWVLGSWTSSNVPVDDKVCGHIGSFPQLPQEEECKINTLELWPVLVGLRRWHHLFKDKRITVYVDNTQVKYMLTNSVSSNPTCMLWLREIFWLCVNSNIQLNPTYISSADNYLADTLSRVNGDKFIDVSQFYTEVKDWCCSKMLLSLFSRWRFDREDRISYGHQ